MWERCMHLAKWLFGCRFLWAESGCIRAGVHPAWCHVWWCLLAASRNRCLGRKDELNRKWYFPRAFFWTSGSLLFFRSVLSCGLCPYNSTAWEHFSLNCLIGFQSIYTSGLLYDYWLLSAQSWVSLEWGKRFPASTTVTWRVPCPAHSLCSFPWKLDLYLLTPCPVLPPMIVTKT